jgi:hypothetical protein
MSDEQKRSEEAQLGQDIEGFLQQIVKCEETTAGRLEQPAVGRPPILPALVLWSSVVVAVLRGFSSQLAVWRLVSWQGLWHYGRYEVCDQAVYNRLAAGGSKELQGLFYQVRDALQARLVAYAQQGLASFASGVYALDGSTLDKMARHLPALRTIANGDSRLLPGKMVGLFDIRWQQWREMVTLSNPHQNDKTVAQELVAGLPAGSLLLADLGFFGFAWFDHLTERSIWWISRLREKTSYEVIHTYYQQGELFDGLIWLGKYRADKAAHAVRLLTFTLGQTRYQYITNVLDPQWLPLREVAILYARRWDIELAFKMVKRYLNLHILWSAKDEVIQQQLWAVLIIAQILHALHLEIAGLAQVDPFDVSLQLLTRYVPILTLEGKNPIQMIVQDGRRVGLIRPSRRIRPQTPFIDPQQIVPLPPDTVLWRQPRYAQRNCTARSASATTRNKASPDLVPYPSGYH